MADLWHVDLEGSWAHVQRHERASSKDPEVPGRVARADHDAAVAASGYLLKQGCQSKSLDMPQ